MATHFERSPWELLEPAVARWTKWSPAFYLARHFHSVIGITVDPRSRLVLFTREGKRLRIRSETTEVEFTRAPGEPPPGLIRFRPVDGPPGTRYKLAVATWADGSRAYLDSRGLLHLKSADSFVPETSLVLASGRTAVWSSRAGLRGSNVYTDTASHHFKYFEYSEEPEDFDDLQRFVERLP